MYIDPTGYFSLTEMGVTTKIMAVINVAYTSKTVKFGLYILDGLCTVYDVMQQIEPGADLEDLTAALANGLYTSVMLGFACKMQVVGIILGPMLIAYGMFNQVASVCEAIKEKRFDLVYTRTIQTFISVGSLTQSCFTEETLIETEHGYKEIKDIEVGDKVLSYNKF